MKRLYQRDGSEYRNEDLRHITYLLDDNIVVDIIESEGCITLYLEHMIEDIEHGYEYSYSLEHGRSHPCYTRYVNMMDIEDVPFYEIIKNLNSYVVRTALSDYQET